MGNLGMITCQKEDAAAEEKLFKQLSSKLRALRNRKKVEIGVQYTEIFEGLKWYTITLPYKQSELGGMKQGSISRLGSLINELCIRNQITCCILPEGAPEILQPESCVREGFTGHHLFKSILPLFFEEIFSKRGIKICDLDITIIHGESNPELFGMIYMLAPAVKYLTVATGKKEAIEEEMHRICMETGLAVSIATGPRSLSKKADVIINLSDWTEWNPQPRIHARAMVINCHPRSMRSTAQENVLIQGVLIRLPKNVMEGIPAELLQRMPPMGMAEMLLCYRMGWESTWENREWDEKDMERLFRQFRKDGLRIEGFIGRYGVLKNADLRLYGT